MICLIKYAIFSSALDYSIQNVALIVTHADGMYDSTVYHHGGVCLY